MPIFTLLLHANAHFHTFPIQWAPVAVSLGWQVHEADHPPPSSAEVKNGGAIHPLTHTSSWHGA
jgi:hypothetical protein